ncbi:MAG TPA: hypothetical protein VHB79_33755 [Polyangiaceae bacterium]|nr:hypothetical protein [Polyangiaceae bacterium]
MLKSLRVHHALSLVLTLLAVPLGSRQAFAQEVASAPIPKEGRFGAGVSAIVPGLGLTEVFAAGGHALGFRLWAGAQIDLGPRWALRLPLMLGVASGGSRMGYAELDLVPGVLYRFRNSASQRLTPYVGLGAKLGVFGADRPLLGLPLLGTTQQALDWDHHHHSGDGSSDPDFDGTVTVGGELWLGASWHIARLFSLDFDLAASMLSIDSVLVVGVSETVAARLTF